MLKEIEHINAEGSINSVGEVASLLSKKSKGTTLTLYAACWMEVSGLFLKKWILDDMSSIHPGAINDILSPGYGPNYRFTLNNRHFNQNNREWFLFENYLHAWRVHCLMEELRKSKKTG